VASLRKKGRVWYVRIRDESGRQREVKAGPDKSIAQSIARDLESKTQRIKAGVLDPREAGCLDAERTPITQHMDDYVQGLEAKGCVQGHVDGVQKRLAWFLEESKISRLSQLRPSLVTTSLKTLRDSARSDRTVSHYCAALKSFSRWAWKDRRTREDLLADLERPKIVTENKRAALSVEQATRLVTTTRTGKFRRGMSGEDRSWLYTLAIYTGLRRSELQSLTPESFNLDTTSPSVALPGSETKNSNDAIQPLPSHVIPSLRSWLATKPSLTPLFPTDRNSSLMIKADLKAAGIPADEYDFHGLRHCYVSQIVQSGASVKDAMELARHSDADLTFNRYAHTRLGVHDMVCDSGFHTARRYGRRPVAVSCRFSQKLFMGSVSLR
jgi:integrase